MTATGQVDAAAVEMEGIVKSFNGIQVLHGVDFEVQRGEVHALMGGNGAGKSTLMKILEGVYQADGGEIRVAGKPEQIHSPYDAKRLGIGMVFQEFSLIPTLTVAQNIFLTHEPRDRWGLIDDAEAERRARTLFADMKVDINPRTEVARLSTGYWQLTEIAKALAQDAHVLILDEPTAALTLSETQALFELVRTLKGRGIAIIYISHRMEEIFEIADRVSVLRDGRRVLTAATSEITMPQLVEQIVGRKMEQAYEWKARPVERAAAPLLAVRHLRAGPRVRDVSFDLFPGEILGIAGLMGSGRTELLRALFGMDPIQAGQIEVAGRAITLRDPQDALAAGIALVPEDRRAQGLVLSHSVKDNLLLPLLDQLQQNGLIDDRQGDALVEGYVDSLQIKLGSIHQQIRLLSGGNQQKVVIAKWLASRPEILLMDEPTAGVDIGAKTEILDVIRRLADEGKGVIVVSSEFTELLAVADRILVLRNGRVTQEMERGAIATEQVLQQAVQRASASEIELSEAELATIRARRARAAIVMHYGGNEWSQAQIDGLKAQFANMGIEVVALSDAGFDPAQQVRDIEAALAQAPDVLVSVPTDPTATAAAYRKAAEAGVKLVFMDNVPDGLVQGSDYISVVSADNYGTGVSAARLMAERLGGQGKVALIFHDSDFYVTRQRHEAFRRTMEELFPNVQIVAERGVQGPDFAAAAERATSDLLQQHPDLAGIWAVWDVPASGVVAALRRAGRNDIVVTTNDLGTAMAQELAQGDIVWGVAAQRPFDQGVTEALLAGYGLLGKAAPTYVVLDGLPVTRANVLEAWQAIYHQEPPPTLRAARAS